jgi:Effector Associated Constant Component 1
MIAPAKVGQPPMSTKPLIVTFPECPLSDGNRFANTLADALRDADPRIVVERQRERHETQDLGATLVVLLGTAAATAVAKGIGSWLARNSGARLEIRRDGKLVVLATHLDSRDIPRIAAALSTE